MIKLKQLDRIREWWLPLGDWMHINLFFYDKDLKNHQDEIIKQVIAENLDDARMI